MFGDVTYQRTSKASFLDVWMLHPRSVPRATPLGAAASGAHGGLRLLHILLSGGS